MGVTLTIQAVALSAEPGGTAETELTVRNTGTVVDQVSLEVVGVAAAWSVLDPPTVSLFPGDEAPVQLRLSPPRLPTTEPGTVRFAVKAVSAEQPDARAVEEASIDVAAFSETTAELVPGVARGRRRATYDVAVDNRGNRPLRADLAALDGEGTLRFGFHPPALEVAPGTAAFARLRVEPSKRFWRGAPRTHTFTTVVTPDGGDPVALQGTAVQEPLLPSWVPKVIAGMLAALVALLALWFTLLRPRIDSALDHAAEEAAERATETTQSGGGDGTSGGNGSEGEGGGDGGDGGSGAPAGPEPIDLRLSTNGLDGQAPYPVAENKRLEVTDLVFQNPDQSFGHVTVYRNDSAQPLLRLNLANFRDYDFHFVSPVVFVARDRLVFEVVCTGPDGVTSSPCVGAPSLYVVGSVFDV